MYIHLYNKFKRLLINLKVESWELLCVTHFRTDRSAWAWVMVEWSEMWAQVVHKEAQVLCSAVMIMLRVSGKAEIYSIERVMFPLGDTAMMKIIWCDGSGTNIELRLKRCLVNGHISGWPFTGAQSTCVSSVVGGPGIGTTGPASAPGCQNGHCWRLSRTHSQNGMHRVCAVTQGMGWIVHGSIFPPCWVKKMAWVAGIGKAEKKDTSPRLHKLKEWWLEWWRHCSNCRIWRSASFHENDSSGMATDGSFQILIALGYELYVSTVPGRIGESVAIVDPGYNHYLWPTGRNYFPNWWQRDNSKKGDDEILSWEVAPGDQALVRHFPLYHSAWVHGF